MMYKEAGLDKILGPLVGRASDGDSRRRADQVESAHFFETLCAARFSGSVLLNMSVLAGSFVPLSMEGRFRAVDHPSFGYSSKVDEAARPCDIADQDWLQ